MGNKEERKKANRRLPKLDYDNLNFDIDEYDDDRLIGKNKDMWQRSEKRHGILEYGREPDEDFMEYWSERGKSYPHDEVVRDPKSRRKALETMISAIGKRETDAISKGKDIYLDEPPAGIRKPDRKMDSPKIWTSEREYDRAKAAKYASTGRHPNTLERANRELMSKARSRQFDRDVEKYGRKKAEELEEERIKTRGKEYDEEFRKNFVGPQKK